MLVETVLVGTRVRTNRQELNKSLDSRLKLLWDSGRILSMTFTRRQFRSLVLAQPRFQRLPTNRRRILQQIEQVGTAETDRRADARRRIPD